MIGNFSYVKSGIKAFDPTTGAFLGSIPINVGVGNTPGGLWALEFGTGGMNGSPDTLYFTDGIDGETHGLFGALTSVPEPSTWVMMLLGPGGLGFAASLRHRSRKSAIAFVAE